MYNVHAFLLVLAIYDHFKLCFVIHRMVIGRDGQTIRKIQNETGAKVQFNTVDPNAVGERWVLVQGSREQVNIFPYSLFL